MPPVRPLHYNSTGREDVLCLVCLPRGVRPSKGKGVFYGRHMRYTSDRRQVTCKRCLQAMQRGTGGPDPTRGELTPCA